MQMKNTSSLLTIFIALFFAGSVFGQGNFWDRDLKLRLERMADSLTTNLKPWKVPNRVFKVEDFGAVTDTTVVNTVAIQKAIDECSANGGGVVLFSKGDYVTGTIELKSGVMLEVTKGARILGSLKLTDYPEKIEQFKSVMSENHKYRLSLIYAERVDKIGIRGKGKINFRGERANFPGPETIGEILGRPFGIRMIECNNVVLQDIELRNAAAWLQSYLYCNNLIFDGVKVVNHANVNNDGIDPDGCTNLILRNCHFNSEDDCFCLKGASGKPTRNILVENTKLYSTRDAIKIGTDTQGDFENILFRNLTIGGVPEGEPTIGGHKSISGFTLATVDGGNVSGIYTTNVVINNSNCPLFIRIGNRGRVMPGLPKPPAGLLENVVFNNISGSNNGIQGSLISGVKSKQVENVLIRNYKVNMIGGGDSILIKQPVKDDEGGYPAALYYSNKGLPAYGFYVRHAKNIKFEKVSVIPLKPEGRPAFYNGPNVESIIANGVKLK